MKEFNHEDTKGREGNYSSTPLRTLACRTGYFLRFAEGLRDFPDFGFEEGLTDFTANFAVVFALATAFFAMVFKDFAASVF